MLRPVIRGSNRLIGGSWFAIYGLPPLLLSFTVCMFVNMKG